MPIPGSPNCVPLGFVCRLLGAASLVLVAATAQQESTSAGAAVWIGARRSVAGGLFRSRLTAPDSGSDYGIWAAGSHYKASFHDGATYVPLLGMDYPYNLPLRWQTQSVRVGAYELVTAPGRLAYTDWRAEYDLGGVIEAYDVRVDGLEQTFVLGQRPSASGDLVVRGAIRTELQASAAGAAHQPIVFRDAAGRPIVTYGAATAVDAAGRTQAMTTSYENGEVVLRLAGEWLAGAEFPVVVDPLLGPATGAGGLTRTEVDSFADDQLTGDCVWIAYCVAASASDSDLYVRRWSAAGALGSTPFLDLTSSWSTRGPACEYEEATADGIIAFDRTFASGSRAVRCHVHSRDDATTGTTVIFIGASDNAWRADVGGVTRYVSTGQALLVWQQEPNGGGAFAETATSDIFGCYLDLYTGTAAAPFQIANLAFSDLERPRTNNRTDIGSWKVVCQTYTTFGSNNAWRVAVRDVNRSGVVSAPYYVDSGSPDHKLAPQIDGVDQELLVAFTTSTLAQQPGIPTGSNGHQIRTVRLSWISGVPSEPHGTVVLQSNNDARLQLGGLAVEGYSRMWGLLFRSTASEILYFRSVGYRGRQIQAETVFDPSGSDTAVAGGVSNMLDGRFTIAYAKNGSAGSNYVTFDQFEFPAAAPVVSTGTGCGPAGIQWIGRQWIGGGGSYAVLTGLPPLPAYGFLVLGLAPTQFVFQGFSLVADGCSLLVPSAGADHIAIVDMGPYAFFPLTALIPLPENLSNFTLYCQGFHLDPSLGQLLSTQRLEVPLVR
jgi:hypothetical protein